MRPARVAALILMCGAAGATTAAQDWDTPRRRSGDGVHIRVGRSYHLPADQVAPSTVVVIGASATIDGRLEDDLVVIGGRVRIGPTAQIRGEVTAVGGGIDLAEAADVTGRINDVGIAVGWPDWRWVFRERWVDLDSTVWAFFGLVGTLLRLTLTMAAACVLALVGPRWIRDVDARASAAPFASTLLGFVVEVLFVPLLAALVVGLVISLLGIPLLVLLPFGLIAFAVLWLGGFAGVAGRIGRGVRRSATGPDVPVLDVACGVWTIGAVTLAGQILALMPFGGAAATAFTAAGLAIEYLAWTAGLGAVLTARVRDRWGATPPPIPAPASYPTSA